MIILHLNIYAHVELMACLQMVHTQDTHLIITVPADALAPNGARPSAGTVTIAKLPLFSTKF